MRVRTVTASTAPVELQERLRAWRRSYRCTNPRRYERARRVAPRCLDAVIPVLVAALDVVEAADFLVRFGGGHLELKAAITRVDAALGKPPEGGAP